MLTSGKRSVTDPPTPADVPAAVPPQETVLASEQVLPASSQGDPAVPRRCEPVSSFAPTRGTGRNLPRLPNPTPSTEAIAHSACSCGAAAPAGQLVYALGQLGFDFGTEARRDAFTQNMAEPSPGVPPNPSDPRQLLNYLQSNPWDAASLIWTLSLDGTTIYAVMPQGPFASDAYQRLRQYLREQLEQGVERVSIPGIISGRARLLNGQVVPIIVPAIRGMFNWTTLALVSAVVGAAPPESAAAEEKQAHSEKAEGVRSFLERVYYELRNLGITPQERAMNHAGTNAFNIERVYEAAMKKQMDLDSIEVERSPVCRPDSDCWDVKLLFFFPDQQVQTVRKVYRFTVDVSDVVPVTVGPVRSWFVR